MPYLIVTKNIKNFDIRNIFNLLYYYLIIKINKNYIYNSKLIILKFYFI